jgi:hypothetical protein
VTFEGEPRRTTVNGREAWVYNIRVVGFEPGLHDLRDYLVCRAGPGDEPVPSLPVWILQALPTNLPGNLESNPFAPPPDPVGQPAHGLLRQAVLVWLGGLAVLGSGVLFSLWRQGHTPQSLFRSLRFRRGRAGADDTADQARQLQQSVTELQHLLTLVREKRQSDEAWRELEIQFLNAWAIQFGLPAVLAVLHSPQAEIQRRVDVLHRWLHSRETVPREEVEELLAGLRAGLVVRQPEAEGQV